MVVDLSITNGITDLLNGVQDRRSPSLIFLSFFSFHLFPLRISFSLKDHLISSIRIRNSLRGGWHDPLDRPGQDRLRRQRSRLLHDNDCICLFPYDKKKGSPTLIPIDREALGELGRHGLHERALFSHQFTVGWFDLISGSGSPPYDGHVYALIPLPRGGILRFHIEQQGSCIAASFFA